MSGKQLNELQAALRERTILVESGGRLEKQELPNGTVMKLKS
jgi:hypothetical protein